MSGLRLTDAGRSALADETNVQLAEVQIRKLALGSGKGPGGSADDDRTTLRTQELVEAVAGDDTGPDRVAFTGTFNPVTDFKVTEAGVIARVGDAGAEFLLAYWAVQTDAEALTSAHTGTKLVISGTLDITNSAADVAITVDASVTLAGAAKLTGLSDTPAAIGAAKYVRGNNAGTAVEFDEAPPTVATEAALPPHNTAVQKVYRVANLAGTGLPALAVLGTGKWHFFPVHAGVAGPVDVKAAAYDSTAADNGKTLEIDASGGPRAVNLPDLGAGDDGHTLTVVKTDSSDNQVTIDGNGIDTINGAANYALKSQHEAVILKWTGTAWLAIGGASTDWVRRTAGAPPSLRLIGNVGTSLPGARGIWIDSGVDIPAGAGSDELWMIGETVTFRSGLVTDLDNSIAGQPLGTSKAWRAGVNLYLGRAAGGRIHFAVAQNANTWFYPLDLRRLVIT